VNLQHIYPSCPTGRLDASVDTTWFGPTTEFIGCLFYNFKLVNANGGAIYYEDSEGALLSIENCRFENLTVTGDSIDGGALSIRSLGTLCLASSPFKSTSAYEGGAMEIVSVSASMLIHNSSSLDSKATRHEGAIYFRDKNVTGTSCSNHSTFGTVFGCLLKDWRVLGGDGGGLLIRSPPPAGCVRSCVFDGCTATTNGGGIYFKTITDVAATATILYFCFFNENTASINGCDVFIFDDKFSDPHVPFQYSYRTHSGTNRVNQNGANKDEWLSVAPSSFNQTVKSNGGRDSFGCGINESFPCESLG
jgi:hypothetical protein